MWKSSLPERLQKAELCRGYFTVQKVDAAGFPAQTLRMAKKAAAKSSAETSVRGVHAASTSAMPATPKRAEARAPQTAAARPSALVDTRVIYCGDNLEQLA